MPNRPPLTLIAAVADNGVIGAAGDMPWRLPADLARFRALTMGKPVVMGRTTFESIGRPLAGRTNIVVTSRPLPAAGGVEIASSLAAALALAAEVAAASGASEIMVIGGQHLYETTIAIADRLAITHVHASPAGDAFFPPIDPLLWRAMSRLPLPADEKNAYATEFTVYERRIAQDGG